jgi:hypothetical protein
MALPSQQGGLEGELVREEFLQKHFKILAITFAGYEAGNVAFG